jgi:hypothetical protein
MTRTIEIICPRCQSKVTRISADQKTLDDGKCPMVSGPACDYCGSAEWKRLLEQGKAYTPRGIETVGGVS